MRLGLRGRLTLWIGGLLAATVLAGGLSVYWGEKTFLVEKYQESQRALLAAFARTCGDALTIHDELAVMNAASEAARAPGVMEALCLDAEGRVVAGGARGTVVPPRARWREAAGERLAERRWVDLKDGRRYQAELVFDAAALDREISTSLASTRRRLALFLGLAFVAGFLGAGVLARGITRPLFRINEGTRALARGELDHRIAVERRDEVGALAEDFNAMALRLGELDRMKEDFVSNVTHELRSPLSALECHANLIEEELRAGRTPAAVEYLAVVRNNATRLGKFINDILDLAKIDANVEDLDKEPVAVGPLLRDVAALFGPKAREKGVALDVETPTEEVVVPAEPDKLHQILANLVSNALKFTPSGGRVRLAAGPGPTGFFRITVSDTGPGIAPQDQRRIFDRFEQVRDQRERGAGNKGTGLGLAIAQGLAVAHGGRIELDSGPGRGSAFSVLLPRED